MDRLTPSEQSYEGRDPTHGSRPRFDLFSLATLADADRQHSASTEIRTLARDREWFAEGRVRGSHGCFRVPAADLEDMLDWSGYSSEALDL